MCFLPLLLQFLFISELFEVFTANGDNAVYTRAVCVSHYSSNLSKLWMSNHRGLKLHTFIRGFPFPVLEKHHTWRAESRAEVLAKNLLDYIESVLFRTRSVSGCVCALVRGAPDSKSVNCHVLVGSSPPIVSWQLWCIQVSLTWAHTDTHAAAFPGICWWSRIPDCLQPVSQHQGWAYWQTHWCGLCFSFQALHAISLFFH